MSGIIYFASGKTLELSEDERMALIRRFQDGGVRRYQSKEGHVVPFSINTIEMVEFVPEPVIEEDVVEEINEKIADHFEEVTVEDKKEKAEADFMARASCTHEDQKLYRQNTAKGVRYFPVCEFCGKRERYVSEKKIIDGEYEDWSQEDIDSAEIYVEK